MEEVDAEIIMGRNPSDFGVERLDIDRHITIKWESNTRADNTSQLIIPYCVTSSTNFKPWPIDTYSNATSII